MFRAVVLIGLFILSVNPAPAQDVSDAEFKKANADLARYYKSGDLNNALVAAERLVQIVTARHGNNHLTTAKALKNRGFIEDLKGDTNRAKRTFEDAIDVYKKQKELSKADSAGLADLLESVGRIRGNEDMFSSEGAFRQALELREKSSGRDAFETAMPLAYLANINFWRRDYKTSAEYYGRALANLGKNPTAIREDVILIYYRTQCAYRKAGIEPEFFMSMETLYGAKANLHAEHVERMAAAAAQGKLVQGGDVTGKAKRLEKPAYPAEARLDRAAGAVPVDVLINEKGDVISACASSNKPHAALIRAAEAAAYRSKFAPSTESGVPIKVFGRIKYNFAR